MKSGIIDEIYEQNGIKYLIKFMHHDQIKNKEIQLLKRKEERTKDPFEPPIDDGILIDEEFTESHRLCFNKFPIIPYHTIIATKNFVDQYTHLDLNGIT
jgi:ATP adenylyltransferase/5',5'''-P-1,P-4-tetraphosphate phosphorylase II